ncbi:MAG TPA: heme-binding protein [Planctomycetota bacterium]
MLTPLFLLAGLAVTAAASPASPLSAGDPVQEAHVKTAGALQKALGEARSYRGAAPQVMAAAVLRAACASQAASLPGESRAAATLRDLADSDLSLAGLAEVLQELSADLSFVPDIEAQLPEGYPAPTPVREIEVKQLPGYRMARAEMASGENGAFWQLFRHIEGNDIAMTAPVRMDFDAAGEREALMAFLYGSTAAGPLGTAGAVQVIDADAQSVVSTGRRGARTPQAVQEAEQQLRAWIERPASAWRIDGPLRVPGYNSPFVPAAQRFWEVQFPVRARGGSGSKLTYL